MAKQQQQPPQRERERGPKVKVGKGKVTALQVAFMVERYLAENKYSKTLAAFRSDAADLFAKMNKSPAAGSKAAMKGLMGLGEILDEYISLKEQKLLLQRDRTRLDSAMHAFHSLFRSYFNDPVDSASPAPLSAASPNSSSSPPPPHLNPHFNLTPNPNADPGPLPPPCSTAPTTVSTPIPIPTTATATATTSTLITTAACSRTTKKRKASTCYTLPASKVTKTHSPSSSQIPSASKLVPVPGNIQNKVQLVNQSIAKSLFRPGQPISIASPETPQPNPASNKTNPTPTCSIVSSERSIIVSPLKGGCGAAYYSVERTCQFTSPLKPDARASGKIREHVKGKLNFDSADVIAGPTEIGIAPNDDKVSSSPSTSSPSSSSDGGETQNQVLDGFDFDFSDFDILNGDFSFSELLVDLDLDHDGFHSHSQSSPEQTNQSPRLNSEVGGEAAQIISPDTSKVSVHDSPDASLPGGHESVTSFRAITKRVKIMSPVKVVRKQ